MQATAAASQQQFAQNPYMGAPGGMPMAPMMMPMNPLAGATEKGADGQPVQTQQSMMMDTTFLYQQMAIHQQMYQQYHALLTQQLALQQQFAQNGQGTTTAAGVPQSPMGGAFPMMPNMAAPQMQVPGMMNPNAAAGDQSATQQQFFMPGMIPAMPFVYPQQTGQAGFNASQAQKEQK